jgi:hypothetical protein
LKIIEALIPKTALAKKKKYFFRRVKTTHISHTVCKLIYFIIFHIYWQVTISLERAIGYLDHFLVIKNYVVLTSVVLQEHLLLQ